MSMLSLKSRRTIATTCRKDRFPLINWLKPGWPGKTAFHFQRHCSVSILCTDIVSFSQKLACLSLPGQAEMARDITRHYYPLLNRIVRSHSGQVDKFLGDGMLAVFHQADHAVNAAVALRQAVAEFNRVRCTGNLSVFPTRFAVHHGDVFVMGLRWSPLSSLTYLGEAVNTAAYLADLVPPGRVFISANTLGLLSGQQASRLWKTVPDKGTHSPLDIYEIVDCA
jgi:adenylate cyclase